MNEEEEVSRSELDRQVDQTIEELRIAGRLYRFSPEPRCKVCKQEDTGLTSVVNKLLAAGESYKSVLQDIEVFNDELEEKEKITYSSIRNHHKKHFATHNTAAAVYRRILEKRAADADVDFVEGVRNAVTPLAYLESMMVKGYQAVTEDISNVDPELGMKAAIQLHNLTQDGPDEDIQEIIFRTNRLIEIVRETVPVTYWDQIVRKIEQEEGTGPAHEIVDAEIEREEDFETDEEEL